MEAVGVGRTRGKPRTVPATRLQTPNSRSSSLCGKKGQCETDSRKGVDEGSREEGEEAGEEGGKEGGKKHKGTKECVIKTGNGRREEGSGGFQKEAGRGRFSRERRSGADTRAV